MDLFREEALEEALDAFVDDMWDSALDGPSGADNFLDALEVLEDETAEAVPAGVLLRRRVGIAADDRGRSDERETAALLPLWPHRGERREPDAEVVEDVAKEADAVTVSP